jgi:predicted PurR-regulated permease PerM
MSIIGIMSFIGLTILHIPYALPLAILAGLLEAVPSIGPTISAVPAIILGLSISPLTGLGALAMSIIIQQSENNLIVPRVMQHVVGVRPIVTIVVLMTGFTLGGVMGAVLAMPIFLALTSIYREFNN